MADFQTSTHRTRWIFTPQELAKYQTANERAKKALEKNGIKQSEERPQAHKTHDDIKGIRHSRSKPLNLEEGKLMRIFYEHKIQEVCAAFKFPHKIQATAIIYFKRFYLEWSVMEHHPKHIMLTCIYASCKIEENHVSAEELGKGIEQDHQVILDNEMTVFQGLDFELVVYAPYRSIEGFVYDMEDFVRENSGQLNNFEELRDTAMKEADMIMLTDAPLLFTPGQLAMAALHKSNYMHGVLDFGRYLDNVICRRNFPQSASELMETIGSINSLTSKLQIPTAHDMKHIDRKLKSCLDPSSIDEIMGSRLFPIDATAVLQFETELAVTSALILVLLLPNFSRNQSYLLESLQDASDLFEFAVMDSLWLRIVEVGHIVQPK